MGELPNGRKVSFTICYAEVANSNQKVDRDMMRSAGCELLAVSQFTIVHEMSVYFSSSNSHFEHFQFSFAKGFPRLFAEKITF